MPSPLTALPIIKRHLAKISRLERWTVITIGMAAAGLLAFAKLGEEMFQGDTRAFDERVLSVLWTAGHSADPVRQAWIEETMRDFSSLGGTGVLVLVTLGVTGFFLLQRNQPLAMMMVGSVGTGVVVSQVLKFGFNRPRPSLVPVLTRVYTPSFPSGHAMMAAVTYLTIAVLCARTQLRKAVKGYLLGLAIFLTLIVGVSRVYIGVHWPTDVLAGWAAGAAWALLCWLVTVAFQRNEPVEH